MALLGHCIWTIINSTLVSLVCIFMNVVDYGIADTLVREDGYHGDEDEYASSGG